MHVGQRNKVMIGYVCVHLFIYCTFELVFEDAWTNCVHWQYVLSFPVPMWRFPLQKHVCFQCCAEWELEDHSYSILDSLDLWLSSRHFSGFSDSFILKLLNSLPTQPFMELWKLGTPLHFFSENPSFFGMLFLASLCAIARQCIKSVIC